MSLPLPVPTFYRLPDVTVLVGSIVGLLDGMHTALSSATDFRGVTIPASHLHTWTKQTAGVTVAVRQSAIPSGPLINPRILFAGAAAGAPAMASPDVFTASNLMVSTAKNTGTYTDWVDANPWTSGQHGGFHRAAGVAANIIGCTLRCYVTQEGAFIDVIQAAASHWWMYAGAIIEPWTDDSGGGSLVSETDNRLYGVIVSGGGGVVDNAFLTANGAQAFTRHGTGAGNAHGYVQIPNASGIYAVERALMMSNAAVAQVDLSGRAVPYEIPMVRSAAGGSAPMGRLRGVFYNGIRQGGLTLDDGATDKGHVIGVDTGSADDCILLRAASAA